MVNKMVIDGENQVLLRASRDNAEYRGESNCFRNPSGSLKWRMHCGVCDEIWRDDRQKLCACWFAEQIAIVEPAQSHTLWDSDQVEPWQASPAQRQIGTWGDSTCGSSRRWHLVNDCRERHCCLRLERWSHPSQYCREHGAGHVVMGIEERGQQEPIAILLGGHQRHVHWWWANFEHFADMSSLFPVF